METDPRPLDLPPSSLSRWQRSGPVIALILLAPIIAEVLYGATRISVIFVLVPEILTWGCAALLIREWVRRWNQRWPSMLLLGLALAVAEEWVIQQTSIAPLVGLAKSAYGREWGVNWVYFLWALGYESVWVVLIPVYLVELLFPHRRRQLWLRTRGMATASVVFVLGAFMAWYGWTQRARVQVFHLPPYSPPVPYLAGALAAILLLILAARALPATAPAATHRSPSAATVAVLTTVLGSAWAAFVLLGFGSAPEIPFTFALAGGIALCAFTVFLMRRWTSSSHWGDLQRFAVVFGGILGCMLGGFVMFRVGGALRIDWIGKAVLNAAALIWLIAVGRRVRIRNRGI